MEEALRVQLDADRKDVAAWLAGRELEDLSIITSMMPEEHLYLKRRGVIEEDATEGITRFSIDAEEVAFGELDGQKVPTYGIVKGIVVLELREPSPRQVELRGLFRPMGKAAVKVEAYLGRLGQQVQEAFTAPKPA
jgi:hypothetical protein